jgi:adenosine/AMP kinase
LQVSRAIKMDLEMVTVDNPENLNLIFGQSHFIKTIEDLYEALIQCRYVKP